MPIKAILAHDAHWGIGKGGDLPWPKNPDDLKWFKECTANGVVVMGSNTWDSLPIKPLPGRVNLVISSKPAHYFEPKPAGIYSGTDVKRLITEVIERRYTDVKEVWIIGGAQLVETCLPIIDELWLNNVGGDYNCDVFLPKQHITQLFYAKSVEIKSFGIVTTWSKR